LGDPINFTDPFGLESFLTSWIPTGVLATAANFAAGVGDVLSFGATDYVREEMGLNDYVDQSSGAYIAGEVTGMAMSTVIGGAGGSSVATRSGLRMGMSRANAAFPQGLERIERSHWIPARYKWLPQSIRDSSANLKLMWGSDHAVIDEIRNKFIKVNFKGDYSMAHPLIAQWKRMPYWAQGSLIGSIYGQRSYTKINN
jgi:hypothetical protein